MAVPVTLSNSTIPANAPSGAVIGIFNVPGLRFTANGNPFGFFLISGTSLLVAWNGQAIPDTYTIQVIAPGGVPAPITVTIGPAVVILPPPPLPVPVSIALTPASVALHDNSPIGAQVCGWAVTMSDGSVFAGPPTINPGGMVGITGSNCLLSRALTLSDDGSHSFSVSATQNGTSISATLQLNVTAATPAIPTSITLTPSTVSLPSTSPIGTAVCTTVIRMSDGSTFAGALGATPPGTVVATAGKFSLSRALAAPDVGPHTFSVAATQNAVAIVTPLIINVTAATPPPPPPPTGVSPDGATSSAPTGVPLITSAGTWTWGATAANRPGEYNSMLNSNAVGVGLLLQVANSGKLYIKTAGGTWYLWNNGFTSVGATIPTPPPPTPLAPVITVSPTAPQIPDTTALGAVVATYQVAMNDGSPFTGTVGFGPPNMDGGGVFALIATTPTTGQIIVAPHGPGVGPNLTTITNHITLVASQ